MLDRLSFLRLLLVSLLVPATACVAGGGAPGDAPAASDDEAKPWADPSVIADDAVPRAAAADLVDRRPLPAYQTEAERSREVPRPIALRVSRPPSGEVHPPAEYGPTTGVLFRAQDYGSAARQTYFGELIAEVLAAGATPILLEPDQSGVNATTQNILLPAGIDPAAVSWEISSGVDTIWSRDYGPWHVYVNGERAIVDVQYYDTRPDDDLVPLTLGQTWDEDVYSTLLATEGGNFMTDGLGTCWASNGVLWRNSLSQPEIEAIYRDYVGCDRIVFVEPIPEEGTTHIDMFSKVLNQDTILVGYSTSELGARADEIATLDAAAEIYRNTPRTDGGQWNVVRVPMAFANERSSWGRTRVYYTYTNSLIVNDRVLVPTYDRATDATALALYQDLMPGYAIVGVDSNSVIGLNGAIHCTTMQVPPASYAACGDGVVTGAEECEPTYLAGATCGDLGFSGGTLGCAADCTFDIAGCFGASTCGDGTLDGGEVCDGDAIACADLDGSFASGTATCNASCTGYDTSACELPTPVCGDGVVTGGEVCDSDAVACTDLDAGAYAGGTAICDGSCSGYDTSACELAPVTNDCADAACGSTEGGAIPDVDSAGIASVIHVGGFDDTLGSVHVTVDVTHTYRGDLRVTLTSPSGNTVILHDRSGGSADDLHLALSPNDYAGENPVGDWILRVSDLARYDTGTLDAWSLQLSPQSTTSAGSCELSPCQSSAVTSIPDADTNGITSTIDVDAFEGILASVLVEVDVTHTYQSDLRVVLTSPSGTAVALHDREGGSADDLHLSLDVSNFAGESPVGTWTLWVSDHATYDTGTLDRWSLQLRR